MRAVLLLLAFLAVGPCAEAALSLTNTSSNIKLLRAEIRRPWSNEAAVEPIRGVYLEELAAKIGSNLRQMSNQEMGVTAMQVMRFPTFGIFSYLHSWFLQEIYDSLQFGSTPRDDVKRVSEVSDDISLSSSSKIILVLCNCFMTAVKFICYNFAHCVYNLSTK
jgi:hypothetical protein